MKEISKLKELLKEATSKDYEVNKVIKSLEEAKVANTIEQTNPELAAIEKAQAVKKVQRYSAQEKDAEAKKEQAVLNLRKKIVTGESASTLVHDDSIVPVKKDDITVIKFGSKHDETDKEQLEPSVKAPDPAVDPGFDGPANDMQPTVQPTMVIKNKEEDDMEKKDIKIVIEESMNDLFKILKEEDTEEPMVAEVPAVESPAVEAEVPATEETAKVEEVKSEETVEVAADVKPEVMVTNTSIKIEIPVSGSEEVASEVSEEASEALKEAFRVVYGILSGKALNEEESVEVPMDAEAEVKVEADKIVIEIPVEKPVDEISEEQNEKLQEALSVISYILKEEELGSAAAEPVHDDKAAKEETPEVKSEDVIDSVQPAQDVKEVVVEGTEPHQEDQKLDDKGELVDVEDKVLPVVKAGEVVIPAHDHADAEGKKVRDAIHEELGDAAAEPVHTDAAAKEETPKVENKEILVGQHAEEVKEVIVEAEESSEKIETEKSEETVEVAADVKPEVMVSSDTIRIEIPVEGKELSSEVSEEKMEELKESLRRIHAVFSSRLNEEESVEVPTDAEAEVKVEGDKLVIEIPVESPKEVISSEESKEVESEVQKISESLLGDAAAEPVHTDAPAKEETPEVENKDVLVGQHAEEVKEVIVESELGSAAAEPVHTDAVAKEHTPEVKSEDVIDSVQPAQDVKEVIVEAAKAKLIKAKKELVKKAEKPEAKSSYASVNSSFDFDTDAALYLLKEFKLSREEKVQVVSETAAQLFVEDIKSLIESSGFALTPAGFKKFLKEQKASLSKEEENHLFKEINGVKLSKEFNNSLGGSKSDLKAVIVESELGSAAAEPVATSEAPAKEHTPEVENKDILVGQHAEEVKEVVVESELGSAAAEPVHTDAAAKEHTPKVKSEDVIDSVQPAQDVKEVVVESETKLPEPSDAVDNQYDIDAANKVAMDSSEAKKEAEIVSVKADHKAQPEDVTEAVQYKSLKEAFLLEANYFEKESFAKVTPEEKKEKLSGQLSLLIARENKDPLYEELVKTTAFAKQLQEEIYNKYSRLAKEKSTKLVETLSKKESGKNQASSLKLVEFLYNIENNPELLNEGLGSWIKGKFLLMSVGILPENVLNTIIMKAHTKAMSLAKTPEQRKIVEERFTTTFPDKKSKIAFIKGLIKYAPEKDIQQADQKLKSIATTVSSKVKAQQMQGQTLNASFTHVSENLENETLNEFNIASIFTQAGTALMADSALSLLVGGVGGLIAGLVLSGVIILVNKLIQKISTAIIDAKENSY